MDNVLNVTSLLRSRGKRVTPQRMAVLEAVRQSPGHPSAEEVHSIVRSTMPHISLATVYKALNELRELGQIKVLPISGKLRYDAERVPGHHHLICEQCKHVVDVYSDAPVADLGLDDESRMGFEILAAEVTFRGICPECTREPKSWDRLSEGKAQ